MYGQETVLPIEVNLDAYRLAKQNDLSAVDYHDLMMDNINELSDKRLQDLKEIEKDKLRVARAYNKKVRPKSFQVGKLVWQVVAGLGRSIQDCQGYLRKFLYGGDAARRTSTQGAEWKILEEILPKCLARSLKMKTAGIWISPLALFFRPVLDL